MVAIMGIFVPSLVGKFVPSLVLEVGEDFQDFTAVDLWNLFCGTLKNPAVASRHQKYNETSQGNQA